MQLIQLKLSSYEKIIKANIFLIINFVACVCNPILEHSSFKKHGFRL